jgi:hypothetical protein
MLHIHGQKLSPWILTTQGDFSMQSVASHPQAHHNALAAETRQVLNYAYSVV